MMFRQTCARTLLLRKLLPLRLDHPLMKFCSNLFRFQKRLIVEAFRPILPTFASSAGAFLLLTTFSASAATYTWTSTSSGNWSNPANWSPGVPVNSTSNNASFNTLDLSSDINVHLDTAATLGASSGGALTFGDTNPSGHHWILDNNGSSSNTLTLGGASPNFTVNNLGTGTVTISAEILGSSGIRKSGVGTLILTGANSSLSGGSSLIAGGLGLGHNNALGSGALTIATGTIPAPAAELFAVNGARTINNSIVFASNTGFVTIGGKENLTLAGAITQGGTGSAILQVNNTGQTTVSGGWTYSGSGAIVTGTGDLTVNSAIGGTAGGLNKYGTGTLTLAGVYNATPNLSVDSGTTIINNTASTAASLVLSGGKLVLDLNGFSGGVWNSGSGLSANGGGTLEIRGAPTGTSTQTLAQLNFGTSAVNGGTTNIVIDPGTGAGTTLNVTTAAWTRTGSGTTAFFDLSRTGAAVNASPTLTNGIVGYALVEDSSGIGFATHTSGSLGRYTSATPLASNSNSATTNFKIQPASATPFNWNGVANRSANSLSIDTSVSGGVLDLGGASNVLTMTSGGLLLTGPNDYTIQNGQVGSNSELIVHQYGSGVLTMAGTVAGTTGTLTKAGPGTLSLTGTNAYAGATNIAAGALRAIDGVGLPANSVLRLRGGVLESNGTFTRTIGTAAGNVNWGGSIHTGSGGGFAAHGGTFSIQLNNGTSAITWGSSLNFLNNGHVLTFGSTTANDMVDWQNGLVLNGTQNTSQSREVRVIDNPSVSTDFARISGVISDSGANDVVIKSGDGVLELTGTNTYHGATVITGGTLRVANLADGGVPSNIGQSTNVASNLVINGGTFQYTGSGSTTDRRFSMGTSGATIDASGTGALVLSNSGAVSLDAINTAASNGARTLTLKGSNTGSNTLNATIGDQGGAASLVKSGAGTWILNGAHSYSGSTTINGGTLLISSTASINSTSGIAIAAGTLNYQGSSGLNRDVTVNGGTFKYNSSAAFTGNLTLASGTVGGSGNLSGTALSIGSNITLSPGNSPGTANTGSQTWATGGTYLWEINALATSAPAGSEGNNPGWDFANINGTLTITAGIGQFDLNVDSLLALDNWNGATSYQWRIATASSGVTGFNANVFSINTGMFSDQNATTGGTFSVTNVGNDIYLNYTAAVPEPSVTFLVYFALGTLWLMGARRRARGNVFRN